MEEMSTILPFGRPLGDDVAHDVKTLTEAISR
jgi:hypothetical protein